MHTLVQRSPRAFQFTSIHEPQLMIRLVRNSFKHDVTVVLDLEDGVGDLYAPERTPILKAQAREYLVGLVSQTSSTPHRLRLGVRINSFATEEFVKDLSALQTLSLSGVIACIVLPKVASPEEISGCIHQLTLHEIKYAEVVPIVESQLGLQNIRRIAAEAKNRQIQYIVYGHYDYSLDAGHWPFLEHDEVGFWEWVTPIIKEIESSGLCYVHPPFPHTNDVITFNKILWKLTSLCQHEFGVITVTGQQTSWCTEFSLRSTSQGVQGGLRPTLGRSRNEVVQLARAVVDTYETNRRKNYTFALEPKSGRFISLHEYVAAKRFLGDTRNDS
jgi:citrate lyase beta subunit